MADTTAPEVILKKLEIALELTQNSTGFTRGPDRVKAVFREMYDAVTEAVNENDYGKTSSGESGE